MATRTNPPAAPPLDLQNRCAEQAAAAIAEAFARLRCPPEPSPRVEEVRQQWIRLDCSRRQLNHLATQFLERIRPTEDFSFRPEEKCK